MPERTHPKRIGPYRILELKGEGAWGLVYLAEQEEPVRHKVAVKVLKRGLRGPLAGFWRMACRALAGLRVVCDTAEGDGNERAFHVP